MRPATLIFACLLIACFSAFVPAAESQRWALLIGVNEYAELAPLNYAGPDMLALAGQLKASGFGENRIVLLHDQAKEKKLQPIRANIERELELILKRVKKDDLLLVAFSGHGLWLDGKSYLCPTEARDADPGKTLLAVDSLYKQLEACPAALKILLVDACRNDPRPQGRRSAKPKEDLQKLGATFERPPEGLVVFSSCGPGQVSWEDEKLGHGVFMNYVLKGLSGAADANKNGRVSLEELFEFACDQTEDFVATKRSDFQRPSRKGEINGKFEFLSSAPVPPIPAADSLPSPDHSPLPTTPVTPREVITNSIGMKLVQISAGEFEMGSPSANPIHRVRITQPYYLGMYEVTLGQFLKFYQDSGYYSDAETVAKGTSIKGGHGFVPQTDNKSPFEIKDEFVPWNTGFPQTNDHPVVNVSWNDAQAFCAWLSKKEGKRYRLPTEAEWEYACRAGTRTKYSTGDDDASLAQVANIADASLKRKSAYFSYAVERDDGFPFAAPVGSFKPNAWGLYDMHGNVWEWCADWFEKEYYETLKGRAAVDPQGPLSGSVPVIRGGGWRSSEVYCGPGYRSYDVKARRHCDLGFRVVLSSR